MTCGRRDGRRGRRGQRHRRRVADGGGRFRQPCVQQGQGIIGQRLGQGRLHPNQFRVGAMPKKTNDSDTVRTWIEAARRLVVLTGAGIATESGIPDFRGPQGLWTRNPAAEKRRRCSTTWPIPRCAAAWQSRLESPAWTAEPNAGHRALVALERRGKLHPLSPRTSMASTRGRAPRPSAWWRFTGPCERSCAWRAASGRLWSGRSRGCGQGKRTRPAGRPAVSSNRRRSRSGRGWSPLTSPGRAGGAPVRSDARRGNEAVRLARGRDRPRGQGGGRPGVIVNAD